MPSGSKITHVTSAAHFRTILSSSTFVVCDFYADWCGPCKTIAPIFEHLATAEALPGRLTFAKIDVDSQQDVARAYSVSAMPTFLIFKNGSVSETIRGANPSALRAAVLSAAASAAKGPAKESPAFTSKGHVLGNTTSAKAGTNATSRSPASIFPSMPAPNNIVRFFGLYFSTLFSFDTTAAAEASPYSIRNNSTPVR